jgi:hypothetical protein
MPADRRPELREAIHEHLGFLRLHAECGQNYAEMGDDVGLSYAVLSLTAYANAAEKTCADLRAERERLAAQNCEVQNDIP